MGCFCPSPDVGGWIYVAGVTPAALQRQRLPGPHHGDAEDRAAAFSESGRNFSGPVHGAAAAATEQPPLRPLFSLLPSKFELDFLLVSLLGSKFESEGLLFFSLPSKFELGFGDHREPRPLSSDDSLSSSDSPSRAG